MNILAIEQKLVEEREYWNRLMDYMVESASMDVNSNLTFDLAQQKTARIDRSLKRIKAGTFGQCEKCRTQIDTERPETLIDSDCHLCARCSETIKARTSYLLPRRNLRPASRHTAFASAMA